MIISNAWPQSRMEAGATLRAIELVRAQFPFFEAFQTVDIPFADERRAVRTVLRERGLPHTYTLTRVLGEQQLNLSSVDAALRRRSAAVVIEKLDDAEEAGAEFVAVISGGRPAQTELRADALRALEESLAEICAVAAPRGLHVIVEPLDYEAHKRCALGTTAEAVAICQRLAGRRLPLNVCIDTAHVLLNEEDVRASVAQSRAHLCEFHFCNCVTDRAHPLFGDRHLPFGSPGIVGIPEIATMMADFWRDDFFGRLRPRVYCEVLKPDGVESLEIVAHCQDALERGWAEARRMLLAGGENEASNIV